MFKQILMPQRFGFQILCLHYTTHRVIIRKNTLEVIMLLTDEKFYLETLNTEIPELALVAEYWSAGRIADAEHTFANYIKSALKPELYFQTPYYES